MAGKSTLTSRTAGDVLYEIARRQALTRYGLTAEGLLGRVLWSALIARELLDLLAGRDAMVPDKHVRALLDQAYERLCEAENG